MEEKQITTVVEKITDSSKIQSLVIADKTALLCKILKCSAGDILNHPLPVSKSLSNKFNSLEKEENVVYLGKADKDMKFTKNNDSVFYVFRVLGTKKIFTIRKDAINVQAIVDSVDIKNLSSIYSMSFEDLLNTKITFGLYRRKMQFMGVKFDNFDIDFGEIWALNKSKSYYLSVQMEGLQSSHNEGDTVKLNINDLDFNCKINLKGYNLPRIRKISTGDLVTFWYNKERHQGTVLDIIDLQSSYSDKKGKRIRQSYFIVNFNGHQIRFRKNQVKKVYENS